MKPGQDVYTVPIRFWEPMDHAPEQHRLIELFSDGKAYAYHYRWGHNVYTASKVYSNWFAARIAQMRMAREKKEADRREFEAWFRPLLREAFRKRCSIERLLIEQHNEEQQQAAQ